MIYSIVMNRWGIDHLHSYTIGICVNKVVGQVYGKYHGTLHRGGKYDAKLLPHPIVIHDECNSVLELTLYDDDQNNLEVYIVDDKSKTLSIIDKSDRQFFKLEKEHVWRTLPKQVITECLQYINIFTEEEQKFIKDEYERILREGEDEE
jgi:hypothetical protein